MIKTGHLKKGEEGHHWLLSQNEGIFSEFFPGLSKAVPERLKHQMFNVMSLPVDIHRTQHGKWLGEAKSTPAERYWYGTPRWFKSSVNSYGGRGIEPLLPEFPEGSSGLIDLEAPKQIQVGKAEK